MLYFCKDVLRALQSPQKFGMIKQTNHEGGRHEETFHIHPLGSDRFLAGCALLIFYDVFYRDNSGTVQAFFEKLFSVLAPILYGMGMAYLLAPIVNFLERNILRLRDALEKKRGKSIRVHKGWLRAAGIFLTWAFMLVLLYLLFAMLVPELVDSVTTLVNNLESYYKTTYDWVSGLLSDNPKLTELAGSFITRPASGSPQSSCRGCRPPSPTSPAALSPACGASSFSPRISSSASSCPCTCWRPRKERRPLL